MARLFFALTPDGELRQELVLLQQRAGPGCVGQIRLTPPEHFHLTVRFLGDVSGETASHLRPAALAVARRVPPFEITLAGAGFFPDSGRPRVWWAGVDEPPALRTLAAEIEAACTSLGLPPEERPFTPHITLARLKAEGSGEELRAFLEPLTPATRTARVRELALMVSRQDRTGTVYSPLWSVPLEGAA